MVRSALSASRRANFWNASAGKKYLPQGFSLIEMMVALLILAVSILGLTGVTLRAMQVNVGNDLRDTAIRLTNDKVEEFTAAPIDDILSGSEEKDVHLKNGSIAKTFVVGWTVTPESPDLKQIEISVTYRFRGRELTHRTVVFKHRAI